MRKGTGTPGPPYTPAGRKFYSIWRNSMKNNSFTLHLILTIVGVFLSLKMVDLLYRTTFDWFTLTHGEARLAIGSALVFFILATSHFIHQMKNNGKPEKQQESCGKCKGCTMTSCKSEESCENSCQKGCNDCPVKDLSTNQ